METPPVAPSLENLSGSNADVLSNTRTLGGAFAHAVAAVFDHAGALEDLMIVCRHDFDTEVEFQAAIQSAGQRARTLLIVEGPHMGFIK